MDTINANGFPAAAVRPNDKVDWRKRLTSVSRYVTELEDCLEEARSIILTQRKQIERFQLNCEGTCPSGKGGAV
jgi:hypothetical protein